MNNLFKHSNRVIFLVVALGFLFFNAIPAYAVLSEDQKKLYDGGTYFYDIDECGSTEAANEQNTNFLEEAQVMTGSFSETRQIKPTAIMLHFTQGDNYGDPPTKLIDVLKSRVEAGYPNGGWVQLFINASGKLFQLTNTLETRPMQTMADQGWNDVSIGIEIEGMDENALLSNPTQFQTVIGVVKELMAKYNIQNIADRAGKKGVFGHYEANPGNSDPGATFMAQVREELNKTQSTNTPGATPSPGAGTTPENQAGSADFSGSSVTDKGKQLFSEVEGTIKELQPNYQEAAEAENIPWQMLAALHYREAGNDPGASIGSGEPLGSSNPDSNDVWPTDKTENYKRGAQHLKEMAKMVYGIELTATSSFEEMRDAFVAYNRGFMYKRVNQDPDTSPYAMNYYDAEHAGGDGEGMVWPGNASEPGSTQGKVNKQAGAMTIMALLGGAGATDECGQQVGTGDFVFPLDTTKADMESQNGGQFKDGKMSEGGHPYAAHDIMATPGTPVLASIGGTVTRFGEDKCPGRLVEVYNQENDVVVSYLHLSFDGLTVTEGQTVNAGDQIGVVGSASNGCGSAHLHIDAATGQKRPPCKRESCSSENQALYRQGSDKIQLATKLYETYEKLP